MFPHIHPESASRKGRQSSLPAATIALFVFSLKSPKLAGAIARQVALRSLSKNDFNSNIFIFYVLNKKQLDY